MAGSSAVKDKRIDWAGLAAFEMEEARDHPREHTTKSGIAIPAYTTGYRKASWFKLKGEPPQVIVEPPAVAMTRWMAFRDNPDQEVLVFHENQFGQPIFFFREALDQLAYIQVTYPASEQSRTTPGSIWADECPCARYGGPCPPRG